MAALADMYPHGNLPSGIVANTWLAPPCMAAAPHSPKLLPAEDAALGAQNLGCARPRFPEQQDRNWLAEFAEARKLLRAVRPLACAGAARPALVEFPPPRRLE